MLKSHPQSSDVKSPVVFSMCQIHIRRVEWQTNTHLPLGMAWFMAWGLAHWIQDQPQAIETHGAREAAVRQELQDLEKAHRCDFCGDFLAKKTRWSWDVLRWFLRFLRSDMMNQLSTSTLSFSERHHFWTFHQQDMIHVLPIRSEIWFLKIWRVSILKMEQ